MTSLVQDCSPTYILLDSFLFLFFFFNDTATTEIYTLSLHDALPICGVIVRTAAEGAAADDVERDLVFLQRLWKTIQTRSEEHTSELQSRQYLVCRLLLEKKKKTDIDVFLIS